MAEEQSAQPQFEIQRVYVKDLSLEMPGSIDLFKQQWVPKTHIDLNVTNNPLEEGHYEVILRATVEVKNGDQSVLVIEAKQAAIFRLAGFNDEQLDHMLRAYCPNILFPYVREAISDVSVRASFAPITFAPVNFEAIYLQQKEQQGKGEAGEAASE
ncbi:MAG: protein-export chaperone SecB [Gammaproteobacteria bacterium]|nr:protein-export chaperone SecB [Gammaproteobacteria bacterium]